MYSVSSEIFMSNIIYQLSISSLILISPKPPLSKKEGRTAVVNIHCTANNFDVGIPKKNFAQPTIKSKSNQLNIWGQNRIIISYLEL
jgi:hypothetical protein